MTKPKPEAPPQAPSARSGPAAPSSAFEKEVVRLPDGRELTYYRFPEEGSRPAPGEGPNAPAPGEER